MCWQAVNIWGGGIVKKPWFKEAVFNLPLYDEDLPLDAQCEITKLIHKNPLHKQACLEIGVNIDTRSHPLRHRSLNPAYVNLKAMGHVLTGFDFARQKCGFGISLLSALNAF